MSSFSLHLPPLSLSLSLSLSLPLPLPLSTSLGGDEPDSDIPEWMQVGQAGLGKTTFVNNFRESFGEMCNNVFPAASPTSNLLVTPVLPGTLHNVKWKDSKGNEVNYLLQVTCEMSDL